MVRMRARQTRSSALARGRTPGQGCANKGTRKREGADRNAKETGVRAGLDVQLTAT